MTRLLAGVVLTIAITAAAAAQEPASTTKRGDGDVITMRGCVSGSLLKYVQADADTAAGAAAGDRYRMIGPKAIRAEIKKANKAFVEVTGRVRSGPQAVVKGGKVGGTTIGIGAAPGINSVEQQAPYVPTVEVETVEILAKSCPVP